MLASDVANPEFVNPQDPDAGLQVEFFIWDKDDPVDADGKPFTAFKGKPFIRIEKPGDTTLKVEQPLREDHKRRFPRQWKHWQTTQGEGMVIGTPLEAWFEARPGDLTEEQLMLLKIVKFTSCEQLSLASDSQLSKMPMGALGLKVRVQEWLSTQTKSHGAQELEDVKSQLKDSRRQMDEMAAMMSELLAKKTPANKGGRPRKYPLKTAGVTDHGQHAPATGDAGNL